MVFLYTLCPDEDTAVCWTLTHICPA